MNKYEVSVTDQADMDLRGIYEYIATELKSPDSAAGLLDRLESAIQNLDTFPERYRLYQEEPWNSRNLRVLPVDNYIVFYIPNNQEMNVTIIRVIYGGMDIDIQLNRFTKYED